MRSARDSEIDPRTQCLNKDLADTAAADPLARLAVAAAVTRLAAAILRAAVVIHPAAAVLPAVLRLVVTVLQVAHLPVVMVLRVAVLRVDMVLPAAHLPVATAAALPVLRPAATGRPVTVRQARRLLVVHLPATVRRKQATPEVRRVLGAIRRPALRPRRRAKRCSTLASAAAG